MVPAMTNEQSIENDEHLTLLLDSEAQRLKAEPEPRELAETLGRIDLALNHTPNLTEFIDIICQEGSQLFGVEAVYMWLLKGETLVGFARQGPHWNEFMPQRIPLNDAATLGARVVRDKKPIFINNAVQSQQVNQQLIRQFKVKAILGIPLLAGSEPLGALMFLETLNPHRFTEKDVDVALVFGSYVAIAIQNVRLLEAERETRQQAAVAMQNARLYEQVQRYTTALENRVAERTFELQVLLELAQALGQATQLSDIVRLILLHLYQAIPYDVAASLLVGEDLPDPLVIQSPRTLAPALETHLQEIMSSALELLRGEAANSLTVDVRRIQAKQSLPPQPALDKLASVMQTLIFIDETPVGILLIAAEMPQQFNTDHANLLRTVADQAAESIRRLRSLMAAEHRRLGSLVAHLPDGVILLDSDYRLVLANQIAHHFLQACAWREGDERLTHVGNQPLDSFLAATATGLPYELEMTEPSSRIFEITVKSMAVGPEAGGWMLVIRDVTEERATQQRIRQQEQMAAIGQLAAGIAHDFNNILTSIIGFSELLLVEPDIPPLAKQDLERIAKQGQRAAHLVSQILDFSRQSVTEKHPLNIATFLKETVKLLKRTISEAIQISLDIETTGNTYVLEADLTQLQQVITNLAINARDAMPAGGHLQFHLHTLKIGPNDPRPTPDISMGDWIVLVVSDTGVGISLKIMPRIFEPFFTTKEVGQGTGLGLAQVYGIVKQHGGDIEVRSQVGQGATFTLYLPAAPLQNYSVSLPANKATNIPYGNGEVILLVEDDAAVLEAAQAILERLRYQVLTASDGQAALRIYDQYQPSIALVLADLTMPKMGGLDLSIALRERNPAVKILTMTGYPSQGETQKLLSEGFSERLRKPLNIEQLAYMVQRMLHS